MAPDDPAPSGPGTPSGDQHPEDDGTSAPAPGGVAPTLPSPLARVVGVLAVLAAGTAGAFIGYAVTDLQCTGDCTVPAGLGGIVGGAIAAVGVAIVVRLALRAMAEWRTVEARDGRRITQAERRDPRIARKNPPRVR